MECLGRLINYRSHQQPACRTALNYQPVWRSVIVSDEPLGAVDKIVEGVHLFEHPPFLPPFLAKLTSPAYLRDRIDHSTVHETQPCCREVWCHRNTVRSVRIQQHALPTIKFCPAFHRY